MNNLYAPLLAALAVPAVASAATVGTISDFDNLTRQGWTYGVPPDNMTLEVVDLDGSGPDDPVLLLATFRSGGPGSRPAMFNEDDAWTGDYAAAGVGGVEFEVAHDDPSVELALRLVLFTSLGDRWTSAEAFTPPSDGTPVTHTFGVSEADLIRVQGSGTYDAAIGDVVRVMIRHDVAGDSRGDVLLTGMTFDDITLTAAPIPEPTTLALLAAPALLLRRRVRA